MRHAYGRSSRLLAILPLVALGGCAQRADPGTAIAAGRDYLVVAYRDAALGRVRLPPFDAATTPVGVPDAPGGVTVTPDGRFAYVARADRGITGHRIGLADGEVTKLGIPPYDDGARYSSLAVAPNGKFLYGVSATSPEIQAFSIDRTTGALVAAGPRLPSGVATPGGRGLVEPKSRYYYLPNRDDGTVCTFQIDPTTGALRRLGSPVSAGLRPSAASAILHGFRVYVLNAGDDSLSLYDVFQPTGALTLRGSRQLGPAPVAMALSGEYLYVAVAGEKALHVYGSARSGGLDPLPGSPFALPGEGPAPADVRVDAAGKRVFVARYAPGARSLVHAMDLDAQTGVPRDMPGSPFLLGDGVQVTGIDIAHVSTL